MSIMCMKRARYPNIINRIRLVQIRNKSEKSSRICRRSARLARVRHSAAPRLRNRDCLCDRHQAGIAACCCRIDRDRYLLEHPVDSIRPIALAQLAIGTDGAAIGNIVGHQPCHRSSLYQSVPLTDANGLDRAENQPIFLILTSLFRGTIQNAKGCFTDISF